MSFLPFFDHGSYFVSLVKRMRAAQDEYVATTNARAWENYKSLQRKVDQALVSLQDLN